MEPETVNVSSVEISSLRAEVTIRRDERGIPYIEASNEEDLYFAQGYATASDRLWQMDLLRRTARGELSEVFGPATLEQDKLHRMYGFLRLAEVLLERASPRTRTALEAYARGVNSFMESRPDGSLAPEFLALRYAPRAWTAADSLALGKLFAESLSVSADVDILRALLADLPPERLAALLPTVSPLDVLLVGDDEEGPNHSGETSLGRSAARGQLSRAERAAATALLTAIRRWRRASGSDGEVGSNSWVVSGRLTSSGKPLLANDPHLAPTSPPIWYITHLSAPGLRVSGVSVPGLPGVMIGHNEHIAWGLTNLCPDVQDLYFERFDENDPNSYLTPAGWQQAEVRREEIKVRRPSDGAQGEDEVLKVKVTRHGPVVYEEGTLGLSLRWTALDADVVDLEAIFALARASNWDEFVDALRLYGGPPQNFSYADREGHIGYYSAGRIPVRRTGDGSTPYQGTTDDGEWLGYIPFDELPHVFDPPGGVIVTANNRLVGTSYPHHLTHNWRVPYRARRIHELLIAGERLTAEDFLSILGDTYSYPDAIFAGEVAELARATGLDSALWRAMADAFTGWDGRASAESSILPLVVRMREAFRRYVLEDALGAERAHVFEWRNEATFLDRLITERPAEWLPRGFDSYESLLLKCYEEAVDNLSTQLGPDPAEWTWGKLGSVRFPHPLEKMGAAGALFSVPPLPQNTGGSMPTVNAGSRVSMRFLADLSSWEQTRLCIPLGQSGDPSSVHRDDQLEEWRNVTPRFLPFAPEAVVEAARNILVMKPSSKSIYL